MKKTILLALLALAFTPSLFAQVPSYVPTNGLVGYWPFSGNANDESGNGNNGVVSGATLTADRFGNVNKAYSFNGVNNLITILTSTHPTGNVNITYSLWFNCNNNSGDRILLNVGDNGISNKRSAISIDLSSNLNYVAQSNDAPSNYMIPINQWHNFIVTKTANTVKFYIDGMLQNTYSILTGQNLTNSKIVFGSNGTTWGFPSGEYYNGILDDIGIWNRALTADEIVGLYNAENTCQSLVINTGLLSFNPPTYTNSLTIYPNPANDQITIDCGNLASVTGWSIKISNMLGQEVFTAPMNTQQYVVPLNTWSGQGIYFVRIYDAQNNLVNTKKIILQ